MRRALVTLPDGVWRVVDELKGTLGDGDSEVVRNIVISHLSEKGILIPQYNVKGIVGELKDEISTQDVMITSLVELLEESGVVKYADWENRIRRAIQEKSSKALTSYNRKIPNRTVCFTLLRT